MLSYVDLLKLGNVSEICQRKAPYRKMTSERLVKSPQKRSKGVNEIVS